MKAKVKTKKCPNCPTEGSIDELFGWRGGVGRKRAQSYCYACRSGKVVKAKPKKAPVKKTQVKKVTHTITATSGSAKKKAPKVVKLPTDPKKLKALYAKTYPNDSSAHRRSSAAMVERLSKKLAK